MLRLKTSLFGYKKTQVCEYINNLSDELTEKFEQEIKKLQEENLVLKKQLEEQNDVTAVSEIIIEAKNFAKILKDKAIEEHKESLRKIKEADEKLTALRQSINALLSETDDNLNEIQKEIGSMQKQVKI